MARVLPFFPSYVKFLKRSTKVGCIFLGGGVCVWVKASLWTACCCQKFVLKSVVKSISTLNLCSNKNIRESAML